MQLKRQMKRGGESSEWISDVDKKEKRQDPVRMFLGILVINFNTYLILQTVD